ncbi:MAG: tetratricopeptide repeat protein, partial [Planctomycetota bacterium]
MRAFLLLSLILLPFCGCGAPPGGSSGGEPSGSLEEAPSLLALPVDAKGAVDLGRRLTALAEASLPEEAPAADFLVRADVREAIGDLEGALEDLNAAWKTDRRMVLLIRRMALRAAILRPVGLGLVPLLRKDFSYPVFFSPLAPPKPPPEASAAIILDFKEAYDLLSMTNQKNAIELVDLSNKLIQGKFKEVLEGVAAHVSHAEYGPHATRLQALAAIHAGRNRAATEAAERLRKERPAAIGNLLVLGIAALAEGRTKEGAALIETAFLLSPERAGAASIRAAWRTDDAGDAIRRANSLAGGESPPRGLRFLLALMLVRSGRPDEAVKQAKTHAETAPDSASGLLAVGWVRHLCRQDKQALEDLDESIRLAEGRPDNVATRGLVHFTRGRYEEAADDFRTACRLSPDDTQLPQLLFSLGSSLFRSGSYPEAEETLTRAIEQVPDSPFYLLERARVRIELGRLQDAATDVALARKLAPENAEADVVHASVLFNSGKLDEAAPLLDRILARAPEHADALLLRGIL